MDKFNVNEKATDEAAQHNQTQNTAANGSCQQSQAHAYTQAVNRGYNQQQAHAYTQDVSQGYNQQQAHTYTQGVSQGYYYTQPAPRPLTPHEAELNQKKHERRLMSKLGNRTSWGVFTTFIFMYIISIAVTCFIPQTSNPTDYNLLSNLANACASLPSMFIGGALVLLLTKTKLRDALCFRREKSMKNCMLVFMVGMGAIPICNTLSGLVSQNLELIGIQNLSYSIDTGTPEITAMFVIINILCTAIVPAIGEEFLFRGAILGAIKPYGEGFAIVMSSILFGLLHGNLGQIPFAFAGGLFFGFLRVYSGTILLPVILHGINNLFSVISSIIIYSYGEQAAYLFLTIYFLVFGIAAVIGFFILARKDKELLKFNSPKSLISEKDKAVSFVISPGFITFSIIMILETVYVYVAFAYGLI